MKIKKINIHNFRSIKDLVLETNDFSMIIGANNAGKTNIVDAIRIFYEKDLKFTQGRGDPKFVSTNAEESWIEIEYLLTEDEQKNLREEYKSDTNILKIRKYLKSIDSSRVKSNQSNLYAYENGVLSSNLFYGAKNISEAKLGDIIYIPEMAKIDDYTKLSGPSPFRSLLDFVIKKVIKNSPSFEKLDKSFIDFNETFRDETSPEGHSLKSLVNDINEEIRGWNITFDIDINQIKPEEIVKNLVKHYLEDKNLTGQQMDISCFGQGLQRHLIYTLIKLSAKYKDLPTIKEKKEFNPDFTLILFEEPEAFLHPAQQEVLNLNLRELSLEANQQVFITTHSAHFVSQNFDDIPSIIKINKKGPETNCHQIDKDLLDNIFNANLELKELLGLEMSIMDLELEQIRYYLWLDNDRCCAFFADKVLICEGPSDKALIDFLIKTKKIIFNNSKVYVFNADGKYGIHKYMNLFFNLGIKHSVLYDNDNNKNEHVIINNFIKNKKNDLTIDLYNFETDIEDFLGIKKPSDKWLKPFYLLWNFQNNNIKEDKINDFIQIVKTLLESE